MRHFWMEFNVPFFLFQSLLWPLWSNGLFDGTHAFQRPSILFHSRWKCIQFQIVFLFHFSHSPFLKPFIRMQLLKWPNSTIFCKCLRFIWKLHFREYLFVVKLHFSLRIDEMFVSTKGWNSTFTLLFVFKRLGKYIFSF